MKVLNLDDLGAVTRQVTINGVKYDIQDISVEDFIKTTKQAEAFLEREKAGEEVNPSERMEATIVTVKLHIPSIDEAILRGLSMEKLGILSRFMQGLMDEELVKGASDAPAEAKN